MQKKKSKRDKKSKKVKKSEIEVLKSDMLKTVENLRR